MRNEIRPIFAQREATGWRRYCNECARFHFAKMSFLAGLRGAARNSHPISRSAASSKYEYDVDSDEYSRTGAGIGRARPSNSDERPSADEDCGEGGGEQTPGQCQEG